MGCSCLSTTNRVPDIQMDEYSKSVKELQDNPEATFVFQNENKPTEADQGGDELPNIKRKRDSTRTRRMAQIASVNNFQEVFENVRRVPRDKTPEESAIICEVFQHNFIFQNLDLEDQTELVDKMFYCVSKANDYVFKQGDQASSYFFIGEGKCQIIINNEVKKELGPKDSFGELALLYKAPRSASIFTLSECGFWAIDRNTFRTFVEVIIQRDYDQNREFVENVRFFDFLTEAQKDNIASVLLTQRFQTGETIVNEGDSANSFYIVKRGLLQVLKNNKVIRRIEKGESFGEQSLFSNNVRQATVKAQVPSICLALSKEDLVQILGDQIQTVMYDNLKRWAIEKNSLLSKLTKIQTEKLIKHSKNKEMKAGDRVSQKNVICSKLIFLLEGTIIDQLTKKTFMQKGSIYGEEFLKNENQDIVTNVELSMETDGIISEIDFITVIECIGGSLEQTIKKNADSHERYMIYQKPMDKEEGQFMDFKRIQLEHQIGKGNFGTIYLAKYGIDLHSYALKTISKQKILEQGIQKHVIQEKKVLESLNFPFLVKFVRTFKDANSIYFLMDYVKGVELFDVIRELGLLGSHDCMFYIGSLVLCLEYMHTNYIIYRDIKPENIMIDEKGYIVLLDMGTAKFLTGKSGRTHTVIGTPHYMAPEIMLGKGYTYSSDLWSLGVCLFEFATGMHPFAEGIEDPLKIFQITILKKLTFPNFLGDIRLRKFITQLLNIQPEVRLGGSYTRLKSHEWFANFDWDKLIEKQYEPPYIPKRCVLFEKLHSIKPPKQSKEAAQVFRRASINNDPDWDKDF